MVAGEDGGLSDETSAKRRRLELALLECVSDALPTECARMLTPLLQHATAEALGHAHAALPDRLRRLLTVRAARSKWQTLPHALLDGVFACLSWRGRLCLERVCRDWRAALKEGCGWHVADLSQWRFRDVAHLGGRLGRVRCLHGDTLDLDSMRWLAASPHLARSLRSVRIARHAPVAGTLLAAPCLAPATSAAAAVPARARVRARRLAALAAVPRPAKGLGLGPGAWRVYEAVHTLELGRLAPEQYTDAVLAAIVRQMPQLRTLLLQPGRRAVKRCGVTARGLCVLRGLTQLQTLALPRCPTLDDEALRALAAGGAGQTLAQLQLRASPHVTARGLAALFPRLTRLHLIDCAQLAVPGMEAPAARLLSAELPALSALAVLSLHGTVMAPAALAALMPRLCALRELTCGRIDAGGRAGVWNQALATFALAPQLTAVDLDDEQQLLDARGMAQLARLPRLDTLTLTCSSARLTPTALRALYAAPALTDLFLEGARHFGPEHWRALAGTMRLQHLTLRRCQRLCNADLPALARLPRLSHLLLPGVTDLAPAALTAFRRLAPRCHVSTQRTAASPLSVVPPDDAAEDTTDSEDA